jgi:hypothetical protein
MNILRLLQSKYQQKPDLVEIHQYVQDIDRITLLRDKCNNLEEKARYDVVIECMQLALQHLHETE